MLQATPKCFLVGHTAPIVCLVAAKNTLEMECIVSSSENGFDTKPIKIFFFSILRIILMYIEKCVHGI